MNKTDKKDLQGYAFIRNQILHAGVTPATGTSMNKSGINEGDLVLVRQQTCANPGEKVVVLIDDTAMIKHFHREAKVVILKPNSTDKHKPIVLSEEFLIQGVVVATLPAMLQTFIC